MVRQCMPDGGTHLPVSVERTISKQFAGIRSGRVEKNESGNSPLHLTIAFAQALTLTSSPQPILVNDQLEQLYVDLENKGLSAKLSLGESTSSSNSDACDNQSKARVVKRNHKYSRLVMIYEENAPLPPPEVKK